SDRWVVLKGLLNAGDTDAMAVAVAERRFLAEVDHPNIVKIHNFVRHPDELGNLVGYIVMEYVGGSSLHQLRTDQPGDRPLPVARTIAYALDSLTALGYLHSRGLVFCDFKPDNVIQYDRQLKLIDLGAVIRADDQRSPVYGTVGYQAPEVGTRGPSPASDIHTVGRFLAVLALDLPPTRHGQPTPLPTEHPTLARYESFHRLLLRATDPDPLRRFDSAEEMAEQLEGVLREVLATDDGRARPGTSTRFGPCRGSFAASLLIGANPFGETLGEPAAPDPARVAAALPVPLIDLTDPGAGLLASLDTGERDAVLRTMAAARTQLPELSLELRLRVVRAHLEAGDPEPAEAALDELVAEQLGDWRLDWYRGLTQLVRAGAGGAAGHLAASAAAFELVYSTLPGEPAPKLALAAVAECAGRDIEALGYYALVAGPDPTLADATFGRARVAVRGGDRAGALAALDAVPATASHHVGAQLAAITVTLGGPAEQDRERALRAAAARVRCLQLEPATEQRVHAVLLTAALELGPPSTETPGSVGLLGYRWVDRDLRLGLERCLRGCARHSPDRAERIALVDRANQIRPRTWT
ncbi:MAG TPA: tetratricopeptide repeat protein, partial [Pseudonocardia sp.]